MNPTYAKAYENLAWLRATCPDRSLQNGIIAVALAKKARFLSTEGNAILYDIMAAAYASQGNYDNAIRYQLLAIESIDTELAASLKIRLNLYREGKAYQEQSSNRFLGARS